MIPRKNILVKEAVLEGYFALRKQKILDSPALKKGLCVTAALLIAGGMTAGIDRLSAHGNLGVLQQRLFGTVHLNEGTFSARNSNELNQLSWKNGLEILATIDSLNASLQALESLQSTPNPNPERIREIRADIRESETRLKVLFRDRKTLEQTAHRIQLSALYAPAYQEYLEDTRSKLDSLRQFMQKTGTIIPK